MAIIIRRKKATPEPPAPIPAAKAQAPRKAKAPETGNLDEMCLYVLGLSADAIVPWYLMASYLYYVRDFSLLSDSLYDTLSQKLRDGWATLEHRHKDVIDVEGLSAGSQFALKAEDYPSVVRYAALQLANDNLKAGLTQESDVERR